MKKLNYLFIALLLTFTFCENEPTIVENTNQSQIDQDFSSKIELKTDFDIGSENIPFLFKVAVKESNDTSILDGKRIRWDFNSDDIYETDWMLSDSISFTFPTLGKHNITAQIELTENTHAECNTIVYSQPTTDLLNGDTTYFVHEMSYSFDESEIYFVWGYYPHNIYKMKRNGGNIEGVTTSLANDNCRHYPITSPDGKYLAYTYNNGISLLNLSKGEESQIMNYRSYDFNFTNDSKYIMTTYEDLIIINIDTMEDSVIIKGVKYATTIPNSDEIGYVNSSSELVIYDLKNNEKKNTFSNVPYTWGFKILNDKLTFYHQEEHLLYKLNSEKKYKIRIENEMTGWPSEISNDGSSILLSTKKGIKKLMLPSDLEW